MEHCNKIYKVLPDGTIIINCKYINLWKIFQPPLIYTTGPLCDEVREIKFPPQRTTTLTGIIDSISGFTYFTRVNDENILNTPITTDGIALSPYYGGLLASPPINFRLNLSMKAKEIRIYYWDVNAPKLKMMIDGNCMITRYFNVRDLDVTIDPLGFIYFMIDAPKGFTCTLTATSIPPDVNIHPCQPPKFLYLCCDKVARTELEDGEYDIIPLPQWKKVAGLIDFTFKSLEVNIPLTPIPPRIPVGTPLILYSMTNNEFLSTVPDAGGELTYYWTGKAAGNPLNPVLEYAGILVPAPEAIANGGWNFTIVDLYSPGFMVDNNNITQRSVTINWSLTIEAGQAGFIDIDYAYNRGSWTNRNSWNYSKLLNYQGVTVNNTVANFSHSFTYPNIIDFGLRILLYVVDNGVRNSIESRKISYKINASYINAGNL